MRVHHVLPEPGDTFAGRYLIEGLLGRGGMAVVLAAREVDTGRGVALKILYPHVLTSSAAREGFENEARLAARIGGPNLVEVFEAGVDAERELPFLVMERLDGETLGALVARRGALAPAQALAILRDVARALGRAHAVVDEQGKPSPVVHRDLKPDNVFVSRDEAGQSSVRVLDFGIAKVLREATTVTREVKGTPLYMSYEQAARSRITPQTDLWAYGLLAFFLMTGRSYWRSSVDSDGSTIGLFAEVLSLPLASASERARDYGLTPPWSPTFDAWFARCVCRQPRDRFASADEAAAALADALTPAGKPTAGRPRAGRVVVLGALLLGAAGLAVAASGTRTRASAATAVSAEGRSVVDGSTSRETTSPPTPVRLRAEGSAATAERAPGERVKAGGASAGGGGEVAPASRGTMVVTASEGAAATGPARRSAPPEPSAGRPSPALPAPTQPAAPPVNPYADR